MPDFSQTKVHSGPTFYGSGSLNVWREGSTIRVTGNITVTKFASSFFGYPYGVEITWNGAQIWSTYIKSDTNARRGRTDMGSCSFDFSFDSNDAGTVELKCVCCGDNSMAWGSCNVSTEWQHKTVASVYLDAHNPYTPPSIWLNPWDYTKIGKVDRDGWSVHYSYTSSSAGNDPISLPFHEEWSNDWGTWHWEPVIRYISGSSDGVWDTVYLKTSDGFSHGSAYRITLIAKGRRGFISWFLEPS